MSQNTFGVDTAFPPPPPQPPVPGWPPPRPPGKGHGQPRWPLLAAAGVLGAIVATTAAAVLTLQVRETSAKTAPLSVPAPVTVTVAAPAPPSPAPLPSSQADRQTCGTRAEASRLISEASAAQGVIPQGMTVVDPAVQSNAAWKAGVEQAGRLYEQASNTLNVAAGTTPVLAEAVTTASRALHALGITYTTFDAASGNAHDMAKDSSDTMDVLCGRL